MLFIKLPFIIGGTLRKKHINLVLRQITSMASLASKNTFGIDCNTQELIQISELQQLINIAETHEREALFILGGGSNILFVDAAPESVLHMCNRGINYQDDGTDVLLTAMSGEVWHQLVIDSLEQGFSGLENLALIPGLVGAAPIQNIGAYGVELEQRFVSLRAVNIVTGQLKTFTKSECQFGYRDSFFKTPEGRNYCIWDVTLRLDKIFRPSISHQGLAHLQDESDSLSAKQVFNEVVKIRQSKLPDPAELGNAGSFFKNPVISNEQYQTLKSEYPDIVAYSMANNLWKIPAAWLIDRAGLKGYRDGAVGTHVKQALVIVNYGGGTGHELIELAQHIQREVQARFNITLQPEVNIVNQNGLLTLEDLA